MGVGGGGGGGGGGGRGGIKKFHIIVGTLLSMLLASIMMQMGYS